MCGFESRHPFHLKYMAPKKKPFSERFWRHVHKTDACWYWTAHKDKDGYGNTTDDNRCTIRTHRASWMLHNGPIPDGMCVLHKCDNPPCVRPDHLFLGTFKDNAVDRNNKGRSDGGGGSSPGSTNGNSRLDENKVRQIRKLLDEGEKAVTIATKFGVYWLTIHNIKHRKSWKHI